MMLEKKKRKNKRERSNSNNEKRIENKTVPWTREVSREQREIAIGAKRYCNSVFYNSKFNAISRYQ